MFPKVSLTKMFSLVRIRESKVFSFLRMKAPLEKDTVELGKRVIHPPIKEKALAYFNNRNVPIESLVCNESSKQAYSLIQRYRSGDQNAMQTITRIKDVVDNLPSGKHDFDFGDKSLNHIAFMYRLFCKSHFNEHLKFSPLEYPRIFRTIGESEYQALIENKHIVSKLCNDEEVMVTNNPEGVAACTIGKRYFVHFKDRVNFDPLARSFFYLDQNKVPNVYSHNAERAEYYITGGYNIEDVEKIVDPVTKRAVYQMKNKY